jgi:hypothetical protein
MPGQKREARLRARCPGHPRLNSASASKTWMAGHRRAEATPSFGRLRPAMTAADTASSPHQDKCCSRQRRRHPEVRALASLEGCCSAQCVRPSFEARKKERAPTGERNCVRPGDDVALAGTTMLILPRGQITRSCVQPLSHLYGISDFQKLFLTLDPTQLLNLRIPSRERGRWPSSLTLGRGAMDADALLTNGA